MKTYSLPTLLRAYQFAKTVPTAVFRVDWCTELTGREWLKWFREKLHEKINREDKRNWRKLDREYWRDLRWDARIINEYAKRIRNPGMNLLRTPEMRRRYPHVNNQQYERT